MASRQDEDLGLGHSDTKFGVRGKCGKKRANLNKERRKGGLGLGKKEEGN